MKDIKINPYKMFSGELLFLSNMYPCPVSMTINGKDYQFSSAEAAFQAGKCENPEEIELIQKAKNGSMAKRCGRTVKMRSDWPAYRLVWMKQVEENKFKQNPKLMEQLLETYPMELIETNTWFDTYWGVCNGKGENHLGRILMEVREENRNPEEDEKPFFVKIRKTYECTAIVKRPGSENYNETLERIKNHIDQGNLKELFENEGELSFEKVYNVKPTLHDLESYTVID